MSLRRWLSVLCALLGHACARDAPRDPRADSTIVPERLAVTALPGGNGVLTVSALSLRAGAKGLELFAAVSNDGAVPACHAALSVELFDSAEQSLAAGISGLLAQHFYQLVDDSETIAACIGPGDVSMVAVLDLSADVAVEDVAHVVYRCPYFALNVRRVAGLDLTDLTKVRRLAGSAYTGTLRNGLNAALQNPTVSVFPIARSGRPLGMVSASDTSMLAPGATWSFETSAIEVLADSQLAFPAGALSSP